MDTLSKEERSIRMSKIRGRDTKPELVVRKLLFRLGYRYRLSVKGLPGKPDIVFKGRRKIIFVHGCFWHQHAGCKIAHIPKSRQTYWAEKFSQNIARDAQNEQLLREAGWDVFTVWECETKDADVLRQKLIDFMET